MNLVELVKAIKPFVQNWTQSWVMLTTPLTSTSWDGDARSTEATTIIDLSAVFGVPANVKAVVVRIIARESGAHPLTGQYFEIGPDSSGGTWSMAVYPIGSNTYSADTGICVCNADGDIYYKIAASGTTSMNVWLEIWGYLI